MRIRKISTEVICVLFIILWTYAGLSKLFDYQNFRFQLGRSPYVQHMAAFVAVALPVGELIIAALLVFTRTRLLGLYLSFFTMLLFTGYIYIMLHYSYFTPCSCGGILSEMDWETHLVFNVVFTILALLAIFSSGTMYFRKLVLHTAS